MQNISNFILRFYVTGNTQRHLLIIPQHFFYLFLFLELSAVFEVIFTILHISFSFDFLTYRNEHKNTLVSIYYF